MKHKILDLFSGIGGFSYGFEMANLGETIVFVEKDEFCQKVLRKHWKNVPIINDIRKVNGKDFGSATIISGGFPCQPFSVAGKRKGKDDDRYLWDETIRVVAECKPKWFIGENVDGIVNISEGTILRQIQDDLEKEGFQVQCLVIPASGIGAWHQRKRVWIIGHNVSNTKILRPRRRSSQKCRIKKRKFQQTKQKRDSFWSEAKRCSSQDDTASWWQTQSELCGVPDGVSYELHSNRTDRIKALGNSIVPQIAQLVGESILKAEI
ncbi:MAG: putative cytosine-specific methyltransferase [Prokaryotic dsDNA virus sp.]|nr:MAG: putative cytosine-specific methyltransferase [Prokaryotic dsDNA virus sp.]|tara:strand:+ start:1623 stop:2417 length:795 start_codon:yes stop_codon:yes gene_type:complete